MTGQQTMSKDKALALLGEATSEKASAARRIAEASEAREKADNAWMEADAKFETAMAHLKNALEREAGV